MRSRVTLIILAWSVLLIGLGLMMSGPIDRARDGIAEALGPESEQVGVLEGRYADASTRFTALVLNQAVLIVLGASGCFVVFGWYLLKRIQRSGSPGSGAASEGTSPVHRS